MLRSVNMPSLAGVSLLSLFDKAPQPAVIEEASRAKALAEKWFGVARQSADFVCIDLGIGIGAGIILNGHLHNAPHSGEIGHIVIREGGRECLCGHHGCLEAYISERVLCEELSQTEGRKLSSLTQLCATPSPASCTRLEEAGYSLGLALAGLVNILCPPLIVLSGNITRFLPIISPGMERGLSEAALPACLRNVIVKSSSFTPGLSGALGAAAAAMSQVFEVSESAPGLYQVPDGLPRSRVRARTS